MDTRSLNLSLLRILTASEDIEPKFESDVLALGVIIYFVLINGKHPFGERI